MHPCSCESTLKMVKNLRIIVAMMSNIVDIIDDINCVTYYDDLDRDAVSNKLSSGQTEFAHNFSVLVA